MNTEEKVLETVAEILREIEKEPDGGLRRDTSLLDSGLLDSHSILTLALWIEEQIGSEIDLSELDLVELWDTPARIAGFIERSR